MPGLVFSDRNNVDIPLEGITGVTDDEGNDNNFVNSPTELQVDNNDNENDDQNDDSTHQEEQEEAPSTIKGADNNHTPPTRL